MSTEANNAQNGAGTEGQNTAGDNNAQANGQEGANQNNNAEGTQNKGPEGDKGQEGSKADGDKGKSTEGNGNVEYKPFTLPEGYEITEEAFKSFSKLAGEMGLSQQDAQALVDFQVNTEKSREESAKVYRQSLLEKAKADKEIGGANFDKSVATAVKAVEKFGGQELKDYLNETGLGNDLRVIKAFKKIGELISEDGVFNGKGAEDNDVARTPGGAPMFKFKGM